MGANLYSWQRLLEEKVFPARVEINKIKVKDKDLTPMLNPNAPKAKENDETGEEKSNENIYCRN